jgi:DNA-binding NtrC family response regulator
VEQFVTRFNRLQQKSVQGIAPEALSLLMAHDWPGNIRELENAIEHAFILCNDGDIDIAHLPRELTRTWHLRHLVDIRSAHDILDAEIHPRRPGTQRLQPAAAARELGIHKTTLFRRMKKLGITPPPRDGRNRSHRDK